MGKGRRERDRKPFYRMEKIFMKIGLFFFESLAFGFVLWQTTIKIFFIFAQEKQQRNQCE